MLVANVNEKFINLKVGKRHQEKESAERKRNCCIFEVRMAAIMDNIIERRFWYIVQFAYKR